MKNMTIANLIEATKGQYFGPEEKLSFEVTGIVKDNREVKEGNLFVPFKGARVDAHDFIKGAYETGAAVVLSEYDLSDRIKEWKLGEDFAYIKVESCPEAWKDLAAFYRQQLNCIIIGVVGSVGKTSTKEMVASVVGTKYHVQKTAGNFNNEIGLPLTIFSIDESHEVAIVEMGISDFGEMERLAKIAKPDMVVMTNIGCCHLEQLIDRDGVLKAKTEVIPYIKEGGVLVVNLDDDKLATIEKPEGVELLGYGMNEKATAYATDCKVEDILAQSAVYHIQGESFEATIPMSGEHNVYNALAAICIGSRMGLTPGQMKQGIENVPVVKGRNNQFASNGCVIIDDCYNANPSSMKASLSVLSNAKGRKIAVLGDMGELGLKEKELHYEVGEFAGEKEIDVILCVGELAKEIARGAKDNHGKQVMTLSTKDEAIEALMNIREEGDTILIKASHFMEFEKIVEAMK